MFEEAEQTNTIEAFNLYLTEFGKDGRFIPIAIAKMNIIVFGEAIDNKPKPENIIKENQNEWLKPSSILQIISIIILLIVLIVIAKK